MKTGAVGIDSPRQSGRSAVLPVKDALRSVRFELRRGRKLLDPMVTRLPRPLSRLASATLETVDPLGKRFSEVMSCVAHRYLDTKSVDGRAVESLSSLLPGADADALFAQTVYGKITEALRILGRGDLLIRERLAAEAFRAARAQAASAANESELAASLLVIMIENEAIGGAALVGRRSLAEEDSEAAIAALFAVLLWLQIEKDDTSDEEMLGMCCDVSMALLSAVRGCRGGREQLAELMEQTARAI